MTKAKPRREPGFYEKPNGKRAYWTGYTWTDRVEHVVLEPEHINLSTPNDAEVSTANREVRTQQGEPSGNSRLSILGWLCGLSILFGIMVLIFGLTTAAVPFIFTIGASLISFGTLALLFWLAAAAVVDELRRPKG